MIKVGIAGFGKIGQLRAEDSYLERNDVEIVGIYDVVKPKKLNLVFFLNLMMIY